MTTTQLATLPPTERAAVALNFDTLKTEAAALAGKWADITEIKDKDGRAQVHAAAMTLRSKCAEIAARAKEARADAVSYQKAVIDLGEKLVAIISPERDRLTFLRDQWDLQREAEKKAAAEAEQARKDRHETNVRTIRSYIESCAGESYESMVYMEARLSEVDVSEIEFEEYAPVAARAKAETLARLSVMLDAAKAREAEQARIKAEQGSEAARLAAERAELARLRAEAAERQRAEDARLATERAAEAARIAAERAELDRIRTEQEAAAKVERDRITAKAAELKRVIDAQRAEIEQQQEAIRAEQRRQEEEAQAQADAKARAEQEEADRKAEVQRAKDAQAAEKRRIAEAEAARADREASLPPADHIALLVAEHYDISEKAAGKWLRALFGSEVRVAA